MDNVSPRASLIILGKAGAPIKVIALRNGLILGRKTNSSEADISLDSKIVSRKHGIFMESAGKYYYSDFGSLNGTYVNEKLLVRKNGEQMTVPYMLHDGDVLRIDRREFNDPHNEAVTMIFSDTFDKQSEWYTCPVKDGFSVRIGMGSNNIVAVNAAAANVNLAEIFERGGHCFVRSLHNGSPVFVNNREIADQCELYERSVIRVANTLIFVLDGKLVYNMRVVKDKGLVVNLVETAVRERGKKKALLRNVNIEVNKGDFVLILGGSGAGKSTFINSILGKYDINGQVFVIGGGKNSIAYVPQKLTIRGNERLIDVVTDTATLRSNVKMGMFEKKQFINETLASLGLLDKAKLQIKNLSGGEQRRASIANEVVTNPDIFFLDEPDSGLDPGSGMELMLQLRAIANKGKIVMLISHNYASYPNVEELFGKVLVLAKSDRDKVGQLAFMGTVKDALSFFGVPALKDITKLINPRSENGYGRADEFIDKFRGWHS